MKKIFVLAAGLLVFNIANAGSLTILTDSTQIEIIRACAFTSYFNKDYKTEVSLFKDAFNLGDNISAQNAANSYDNSGDFINAVKFYKIAIAEGNLDAMVGLAYLYESGKDGTKNFTKAMELYKTAAGSNHKGAMFAVGEMYKKGEGVLKNYQAAMNWYLKASEVNGNLTKDNLYTISSPLAMESVAVLYENGLGIPPNMYKALSWYREALQKLIRQAAGIDYTDKSGWTRSS